MPNRIQKYLQSLLTLTAFFSLINLGPSHLGNLSHRCEQYTLTRNVIVVFRYGLLK